MTGREQTELRTDENRQEACRRGGQSVPKRGKHSSTGMIIFPLCPSLRLAVSVRLSVCLSDCMYASLSLCLSLCLSLSHSVYHLCRSLFSHAGEAEARARGDHVQPQKCVACMRVFVCESARLSVCLFVCVCPSVCVWACGRRRVCIGTKCVCALSVCCAIASVRISVLRIRGGCVSVVSS